MRRFALVPLVWASSALADEAKSEDASTEDVPLITVPDVPALTALDATSNKLDRPDSARGIVGALANTIDKDGTIKSGVGIEIGLRVLRLDKRWTYRQYVDSFWKKLISQSAISIGTSKNTANAMEMATITAPDTQGAIGARIVFIDRADPFLAPGYAGKVTWARQQCADVKDRKLQIECMDKKYNEYTASITPPWNAWGLFAAVVETWNFDKSKLKNHHREALHLWGAGAARLCTWGQVTGGVAWKHAWSDDDTLAIATRIRVGTPRMRTTLDAEYFALRPDTEAKGRWAAGIEVKVSGSGWLTLSAGTDLGGPSSSEISLLSSLKYGMTPTPSFKIDEPRGERK